MSDYTQSIETSTGTIHLRVDNILCFEPNTGLKTSSLEELKENVEVYKSLSEGEKLPLILHVEPLQKIGSREKSYIKNTMGEVFSCVVFCDISTNIQLHCEHLFVFESPGYSGANVQ